MGPAYRILVICGITATLAAGESNQMGKDTVQLRDRGDSTSYILGRDVGGQLKSLGATIKIRPFSAGVINAMRGDSSIIDSVATDSLRRSIAAGMQQFSQKEQQKLEAQGQKDSDKFLAQNKKKPGVKTTASGLQYRVLQKGNGPRPTRDDSVSITYRGMLSDSSVFDSASIPRSFSLQKIIPGLAEGIQLMNQGSEYVFVVPPNLGYGKSGMPPVIPPNSALIFDVTLVSISATGKGASREVR
jgi:FKBP-type peptidyl-prolyl cis-trans isomerase